MIFVTSSSLDVCATAATGRKSVPLTVCKMHALQCMRKKYMIAEDGTCNWPVRSTTGCTSCHMWETCDGRDTSEVTNRPSLCAAVAACRHLICPFNVLSDQTNECRCRDSADCSSPGINVCVRVGEDATAASQTMSECEAGLQRCKGANVTVVSILPCAA